MLRARFAELCAGDTNPSPTRLCAVIRARGPGPSAEEAAVPGGTLAPECLTRCGWARGFCSSLRSCPGCPGARDAVCRAVRQGACQRARRKLCSSCMSAAPTRAAQCMSAGPTRAGARLSLRAEPNLVLRDVASELAVPGRQVAALGVPGVSHGARIRMPVVAPAVTHAAA